MGQVRQSRAAITMPGNLCITWTWARDQIKSTRNISLDGRLGPIRSDVRSYRTMEPPNTHPFIHSWTTTPFPHLALTTSGLIALADLRTVARRTAIRGGSSWLDAAILAPGMHHQQACDFLDRGTPELLAVGPGPGRVVRNSVLANYLVGLRGDGKVLTLEIGPIDGKRFRDEKSDSGTHPLDWLSHFFYLLSPLLTVSALLFMLLFRDTWAIGLTLALMASRLLNIWAIKNRTEPFLPAARDAIPSEYTVDLGGSTARLRGLDVDLQALTGKWLRAQTVIDGYLEALAKVVVYLVAALSANMTQAGSLTLMTLLLTTAMLLGLSNAHAKGIRVGGRYAVLETDRQVRYRV